MVDTGTLVKNLIEIKFSKIPKMIGDFDQSFRDTLSIFPPDFRTLILELKVYFLDRGPLKIQDISLVRQFVDQIQYWQRHFQSNIDEGADVQVGYVQSSSIEASGKVIINGKECITHRSWQAKVFVSQGACFATARWWWKPAISILEKSAARMAACKRIHYYERAMISGRFIQMSP